MRRKLTEAERIEWRVWYFLPFAKMDELPRKVVRFQVRLPMRSSKRNAPHVREFFKELKLRGPLVPLAMQCVT